MFAGVSGARRLLACLSSEKEPDQKGGLASTASRLSAPVTQTQFSDILAGKDILITVVGLHDIDAGLEHLASRCLKVLKIVGLIYPDSRDLPDYTFRQFVILPPASLGLQWPNRPSADVNLFLQLPAAGLEAPVAAPSSLAPGQKPIAFLAKDSAARDRSKTRALSFFVTSCSTCRRHRFAHLISTSTRTAAIPKMLDAGGQHVDQGQPTDPRIARVRRHLTKFAEGADESYQTTA